MSRAINVGGDANAEQLGRDLGGLLWQVGTVVTGAGAAARGVTKLATVGVQLGSASVDVMQLAYRLLKAEGRGLGGVVSLGETGMQFGAGILRQGKPFEAFVQSKLPAGSLDLNTIKSNFRTFDHLTPDGVAISTKTLDTAGVSYQNSANITRQLNRYVDDMLNFVQDGGGGFLLKNSDISAKQMQLAIPAGASADQMGGIARSVQYAQSKSIEIIVTKVK